jgi:pyruvate-formate lyase
VFSFKLAGTTDYGQQSILTIGGYDINTHAPNMTVSWNSLIDTDYWSVRLSKVSLGNTNIALSTNKAIIDSGTSYVVVP